MVSCSSFIFDSSLSRTITLPEVGTIKRSQKLWQIFVLYTIIVQLPGGAECFIGYRKPRTVSTEQRERARQMMIAMNKAKED